MLEIKIIGRGGQGAVTSGQIMAIAAFYDGKQCQTFPMFGVERCGAPVFAFCRISDQPINLRSEVYNPDIVLVLEPSLLEAVNAVEGLKKNGLIIINTKQSPGETGIKGSFNVHTVDATSIALRTFGGPIGINTAILGAFSKITGVITVKSLKKAVEDVFARKGERIVELNQKAVEEVYKESR